MTDIKQNLAITSRFFFTMFDFLSLFLVSNYTVSVALPGSILENAQSPELRTYLAGQVTFFILSFSDKISSINVFTIHISGKTHLI